MNKVYYTIILFFVFLATQKANSQHLAIQKTIDSINNIPYQEKINNTTYSINLYKNNLENAKKIKYKKGIAGSYSNLGLCYYFLGEYEQNTFYMLNAIKEYESLGLKSKLAEAYSEYGYQLKRRKMATALSYMQKGIKLAESINDNNTLKAAYDNYGVLKEMKNEKDSALYYSLKSLKLKELYSDSVGIPYSLNKIALLNLEKNNFSEAKKLFDKAYFIRKKLNDEYGIAENLFFYGDYYKKIKNYSEAINAFNKSIQSCNKNNYIHLNSENFKSLSEIYQSQKQFEKALYNYQRHIALKDSITNIEILEKQSELDTKYETAKKEKQLLENEIEIKKTRVKLILSISVAFVLILLSWLIYKQQKAKNKQQKQEFELKSAITKIETQNKLQEQRLQISRDLHDNIGSQLTFIISSVDNIKYAFDINNKKLDDKLSSINDFAKSTIIELRDTIWAMNKSEISLEDLQGRINNFLEKAKLVKGEIDFDFYIDDNVKEVKFSSLGGMNIYRTIQEALNNSIKYAKPTAVKIIINRDNLNLKIQISDNGIGFDLDNIKLGNGITNMKKRIEEIDGKFSINSEINSGTTITIDLKNI